jgi:ABC-type transporter Mla subunit MlaD
MGKNQAKASEQIQATNTEVQKLAAAMKEHDNQMKEANQQADALHRQIGTGLLFRK